VRRDIERGDGAVLSAHEAVIHKARISVVSRDCTRRQSSLIQFSPFPFPLFSMRSTERQVPETSGVGVSRLAQEAPQSLPGARPQN